MTLLERLGGYRLSKCTSQEFKALYRGFPRKAVMAGGISFLTLSFAGIWIYSLTFSKVKVVHDDFQFGFAQDTQAPMKAQITEFRVEPRNRWLGFFGGRTQVDIRLSGKSLLPIRAVHVSRKQVRKPPTFEFPNGWQVSANYMASDDHANDPLIATCDPNFLIELKLEYSAQPVTGASNAEGDDFSFWISEPIETAGFGFNCYEFKFNEMSRKVALVQGK